MFNPVDFCTTIKNFCLGNNIDPDNCAIRIDNGATCPVVEYGITYDILRDRYTIILSADADDSSATVKTISAGALIDFLESNISEYNNNVSIEIAIRSDKKISRYNAVYVMILGKIMATYSQNKDNTSDIRDEDIYTIDFVVS